jgi:hypothetical protein
MNPTSRSVSLHLQDDDPDEIEDNFDDQDEYVLVEDPDDDEDELPGPENDDDD